MPTIVAQPTQSVWYGGQAPTYFYQPYTYPTYTWWQPWGFRRRRRWSSWRRPHWYTTVGANEGAEQEPQSPGETGYAPGWDRWRQSWGPALDSWRQPWPRRRWRGWRRPYWRTPTWANWMTVGADAAGIPEGSISLEQAVPILAGIYDGSPTLDSKATGRAFLVLARMNPTDVTELAAQMRVEKMSRTAAVITTIGLGLVGGATVAALNPWAAPSTPTNTTGKAALGGAFVGGVLGLVVGLVGSMASRPNPTGRGLGKTARTRVVVQNELDKAAVMTAAALEWQHQQTTQQ